jgi:hypothetical protein
MIPVMLAPPPRRLILAVAHLPPGPDALATVSAACGLPVSDVRLRLTGTLPRVLLSDSDTDRVRELAAALEKAGVPALCCDPDAVTTDKDRIVARHLELSGDGLVVVDRRSERHQLSAGAVALLQRGFRTSTTRENVTTKERKLSLGRAVLSGGLLASKSVSTTSTRTVEASEAFLLIQRLDGQPDVVLYERQLAYQFLGADAGPTAVANFALTVKRVRAIATQAPLDERVGQRPFVEAFSSTAAGDPLDLALHLVRMAHAAGRPRGGS